MSSVIIKLVVIANNLVSMYIVDRVRRRLFIVHGAVTLIPSVAVAGVMDAELKDVCCERDVPARAEISRAECCRGRPETFGGGTDVYGNNMLNEGRSVSSFYRVGGGDDSVCVFVSATDQECAGRLDESGVGEVLVLEV